MQIASASMRAGRQLGHALAAGLANAIARCFADAVC
jgi:hypothetical protein